MSVIEGRFDRIRGRRRAAAAQRAHDRVPEVGERLCYTTPTDAYTPPGSFAAREDTPWTHGGRPAAAADYTPTDDDAREEWS